MPGSLIPVFLLTLLFYARFRAIGVACTHTHTRAELLARTMQAGALIGKLSIRKHECGKTSFRTNSVIDVRERAARLGWMFSFRVTCFYC